MVMLGIIHTCTALLYKPALTEISSNYFDGIKVRDPCPFISVLSLVGKAPISLGCDEFAMGLRIDSPNRRELSRNCHETFAWYSEWVAKVLNM